MNAINEERLIAENTGLVFDCVRKRKIRDHAQFEDATQVGLIALLLSIRSYDEKNEIKFSTYAYTSINNALTKFIHSERKWKGLTHLNEQLIYCKGWDTDLLDGLSKEQQYIAHECLVYGRTEESVGNDLGHNRHKIKRLKQSAIKHIKQQLQ